MLDNERLREIIAACSPSGRRLTLPLSSESVSMASELLTRRSVTSQASEGEVATAHLTQPQYDAVSEALDFRLAGEMEDDLNRAVYERASEKIAAMGRKILYASPSKRVERLEAATHRHVKRGTDYTLIAIATWVSVDPAKDNDDAYVAEMAPGVWHARWAFAPQDPKAEWVRVQTNEPFGVGTVLAVYRSVTGGWLWVRPREEFENGRFQALGDRS